MPEETVLKDKGNGINGTFPVIFENVTGKVVSVL